MAEALERYLAGRTELGPAEGETALFLSQQGTRLSVRTVEEFVRRYADLRSEIARGRLRLADPERAAALFTYMLKAELQECMLFGSIQDVARLDFQGHIDQVVEIFLNGAAPRGLSRGA